MREISIFHQSFVSIKRFNYIADIGSIRLVSNSKNIFPFGVKPLTEFPYATKILSRNEPVVPPRHIRRIFGPGKDLKESCNSPFFIPGINEKIIKKGFWSTFLDLYLF